VNVFNTSLTLASTVRTEISDVTPLVKVAIRPFGVSTGIALINPLHTTCALFINEFQGALVEDLRALIERLVPDRNGYRHDDPRVSDCERGNARAHLRAALLGRTLVVGVNKAISRWAGSSPSSSPSSTGPAGARSTSRSSGSKVIAEPSRRTRADR